MIKIKEIKVIPKSVIKRFSDHAREEYESAGDYAPEIIKHSDRSWLVTLDGKPLFVAGIVRKSLIGSPPELWLLLCRDFCDSLLRSVRAVRELREKLLALYPTIRVKVPLTYKEGHKFAKFFGFAPVNIFKVDSKQFTIYEASNGV